jgi:hypothetical protein
MAVEPRDFNVGMAVLIGLVVGCVVWGAFATLVWWLL